MRAKYLIEIIEEYSLQTLQASMNDFIQKDTVDGIKVTKVLDPYQREDGQLIFIGYILYMPVKDPNHDYTSTNNY